MFGLARVLESLVLGFDSITQGGTGLYLVPLNNLRPVYYTLVALGLVMIFATWRLDNSRLGLKLLAIREKIQLLGDDELTRAMPSRQGIVEIDLHGGRRLRHHTRAVRGTPDNPMTRAEVDAKSYDLMVPVLGRGKARRLCDAVWKLDEMGDVRRLRALLSV